MNGKKLLTVFTFLLLAMQTLYAQLPPEKEVALMKMGRVWIGITANADKGNFDYRAGFFPNDYNVIGFRGQYNELNTGSGFQIGTTSEWPNPYTGLIDTLPIYGPTTNELPIGKVTRPMTNYIRYKYPVQEVNFQTVDLENFGVYDPSKFTDGTYDQIVEVSNEYVYGIEMHRKILAWSQNYNDNYIIFEVTFENKSNFTFDSLYIKMEGNGANSYYSKGITPTVPSNERPNLTRVWNHYYGGRIGDTARVFYQYSADDPDKPGDDMGAPIVTQDGRLLFSDIYFYSILHASKQPFTNPADDVDDFLQPRITYAATATRIPYNVENDIYGSKNFWALAGGFSDYFPMTGNVWPETHHGGNSDELNTYDYSDYPGGTKQGANPMMVSVFGPYVKFEPGQKIRIVYASGIAGLSYQKAIEVGKKWLNKTLENPPNMPDPEKGWLPKEFAFPLDATEMDKIKDRWISSGIDSVMLTAYRAKWNFEHNYKIPQAPPPPSELTVTGYGDGVEIKWSCPDAEAMPNFAGYRIMRRVSNQDTVFYETIYDSDANDRALEHVYKDQSVLYGAQYYYYVQSKARIDKNDPNADPTTRGKMLYSSRVLVPNIFWVNPPRPSSDDLSKVRIVPNPYNINDPLLKTYGFTDQRGIIFFNLPGTCTIKIFTEHGDLVQTIVHDDPARSGSVTWDMLTSSQQVISSGVYIAVIEKPNGELAYHKFVVVR
ncbi:hypothetical protein [Melioribacter sp. OK-6-Me]|uniref:hypothetical protein n=1 Tax=unclassified Melioribacter TaxID=2627329 RepID=UPI003ED8DB06